MAIKFEIYDIQKPISEQEVSIDQLSKFVKHSQRATANLRKKFKKIARAEAKAWRNPRHRG